jgi:uncharacterized integral membrane protein
MSVTVEVKARAAFLFPTRHIRQATFVWAHHHLARPARRKSHAVGNITPMKPRLYLALAIVVLLAIFALQNSSPLTVQLLFWSFQIPQALLILSCGAVGLLIGWLLGATGKKPGK